MDLLPRLENALIEGNSGRNGKGRENVLRRADVTSRERPATKKGAKVPPHIPPSSLRETRFRPGVLSG